MRTSALPDHVPFVHRSLRGKHLRATRSLIRFLGGQKASTVFVSTDNLSAWLDWMLRTAPKNKRSCVEKGCAWMRENLIAARPGDA